MSLVQIFLSAVSSEFRSYREELRGRLKRHNVDVHVQEDFIATGTPTLDKLDAYIRDCSAVIHLVGDMVGALAKPASLQVIRSRYSDLSIRVPILKPFFKRGKRPRLSYTQWEAYLAIYHQKPLIIALPADDAVRDHKHLRDARQCKAQQLHLERLRQLERYPEIVFQNPTDLAAKIFQSALLDILADAKRLDEQQKAFRRVIAPSERLRLQPAAGGEPSDGQPSEVALLESKFTDAISRVLGERLGRISSEASRQQVPASCLPQIIPVCAETLPQIERLSSGKELNAVKPLLENVIKFAEVANERGIAGAKQVYFDAIDRLVHCETFVRLPQTLKNDTDSFLKTMAALAVNSGVDLELLQRYWARSGDVLKVRGYDDPNVNNSALEALQKATELSLRPGGNFAYHSFRSLCIVAARSNITDAEFDKIASRLEQVLLSGGLSSHEQAHVFDGVTEAYAYRYERTRKTCYLQEALKHWELARTGSRLAAACDGEHVEFALRIAKLPIILAQAGIVEPFGSNLADIRANIGQNALDIMKRARVAGSSRVVEQMTNAIIHSDEIKG
jgi:hypothetical protein